MPVAKILTQLDQILSKPVGDFKPATYAVHYCALKVNGEKKQRALLAGGMYLAKPVDFIVQVAVSWIFAIYHTYNTCQEVLRGHELLRDKKFIILSPVLWVGHLIDNLWSTSPLATAVSLIP